MPEFTWTAISPLQHAANAGRYGAAAQEPGVILSEIHGFNLVLVLARRGQWPATSKAAKTLFGVAAPTEPQAVSGKTATLIWSGSDQFYALFPRAANKQPQDDLDKAFAGKASLSDQSDGRAFIRISGAKVRAMLAKLSSLDLDDKIFPVGAAAASSIDHTGVSIWREANSKDGSPVFNVLVTTSFADSIWHAILDSSAEYGVEVTGSHDLN